MKTNNKNFIIDAHAHPDWHGHDLNKSLANMDANRIEKAWLLSWECPDDEYPFNLTHKSMPTFLGHTKGPIPFARCISYKERAPERFVLGYAPDPRRAGAVEKMSGAIDIFGVRVCGEVKFRMQYDNPDAIELFQFCGTRKVPVIMHMDYPIPTSETGLRKSYWNGGSIDSLERAVQACPDTIMVGHGPGFWAHISGDDLARTVRYPRGEVIPGGMVSKLMERYPNMYSDLSAGSCVGALKRDLDFTKQFMLDYQDRILFARDCFDSELQKLIDSLNLPEDVLMKILRDNAVRLIDDADQVAKK
ncbi:MAG: amidohydrolase family protein [Lentisphaerae bacterium]|jgi:predicted TIM-barrel fold metal-dependent hydrolase|nr:amidohydrolase family protein [Lentisphaerota bacterium]